MTATLSVATFGREAPCRAGPGGAGGGRGGGGGQSVAAANTHRLLLLNGRGMKMVVST